MGVPQLLVVPGHRGERIPPRGSVLVRTGLLALAGERGTALIGVSCRGPTKKPENTVCKQNFGNKNFLNSLVNTH